MKWQVVGPDVPVKGNRVTSGIGRLLLILCGWRIKGEFPNRAQTIIALAPHTSNFDFVFGMAAILALRLHVSFLAKHSLFKFPMSMLMNALGGIPVNRDGAQGLVGQMVEKFNQDEQLIMAVAPEGTRDKVTEWKRGFALIAQATNVPVVPVIVDLRRKEIRVEPSIVDVTNVDNTIATMKAYAQKALS